ncbi:putative glycerol kinase 5 isoform X1 [Branchiostoma floridae]|uniref:Glycerol kinase 5 n=1 Tax=Branchiostoma floridae TaxID=7739 RepID=A0A9J7M3N6_BRAFL|nr:putative glycerol kinase 5 isoform X1 [Branchiostoma floridae]
MSDDAKNSSQDDANILGNSSATEQPPNGPREQVPDSPKHQAGQNGPRDQYVVAVDVGTTTLRCHVYDKLANVKGSSSKKVHLLHPKPGWVEMDPEVLWTDFVDVVNEAIRAAGLTADQVAGMGISTQRSTFTMWDRETGKLYHNFLTWQDLRGAELVDLWNNSFTMKALHGGGGLLYYMSRSKRFLAANLLKFLPQQITMKVMWMLQNNLTLRRRAFNGLVSFGTIDTYLLWKLTGGQVYATDYSCASSTGLYDPYIKQWNKFFTNLLSIPISIFPPVEDTSKIHGVCETKLFGAPIPIASLVADQQAAMFGECCFDPGDVKCTMGTGTFMDINVGSNPHTSMAGLYPLIGWKIGDEIVYLAEGNASDTGNAIDWARSIGLFDDYTETVEIVESVEDSNGVHFVPAFNGLQAPVNDPRACSLFLGLSATTTKAHMLRALLESLVFRNKQLYETMLNETKIPITYIRADGGVSNNSFVMQLTADLLNRTITRPKHVDMSSLGAAFLAGLAVGFWKDKEEFRRLKDGMTNHVQIGMWTSKEELKDLQSSEKVFHPRPVSEGVWEKYRPVVEQWEKAVKRSLYWYPAKN